MTSFKTGSGDLDFGEGDSDEKESSAETTNHEESSHTDTHEQSTSQTPPQTPANTSSSTDNSNSANKYPYFVRRSNVGDERDNRLEIHVRSKVVEQEAAFRSELAEQLGVGEVPKTDAREFALLAAYQHPERVAERMQEEGFGELE